MPDTGRRENVTRPPAWPERRRPVAHLPERAHPADQQPQVPVREHFLAADHVSIPGIKPGADHGVALSQLRAGQRNAPRVQRRDRHQLTGHALHPSGHAVMERGLQHGAGVADQHVESAELRDRRVDQALEYLDGKLPVATPELLAHGE